MRGFSLIELLVVITIMGILSSIAIPAYKDHVTRAKVTELLALAQPAKIAVTEALVSGMPHDQINNNKLGLAKLENQGRVKEISILNAVITVTGDSKALDISEDKIFTIALTPKSESGVILWECKATPDELKKYAPASCR